MDANSSSSGRLCHPYVVVIAVLLLQVLAIAFGGGALSADHWSSVEGHEMGGGDFSCEGGLDEVCCSYPGGSDCNDIPGFDLTFITMAVALAIDAGIVAAAIIIVVVVCMTTTVAVRYYALLSVVSCILHLTACIAYATHDHTAELIDNGIRDQHTTYGKGFVLAVLSFLPTVPVAAFYVLIAIAATLGVSERRAGYEQIRATVTVYSSSTTVTATA